MQIGGREFAVLRGANADFEVARQPVRHRDEAVGAVAHARLVAQQHAHLGEAAPEHEALDDFEEGALIVDFGLEIGRHDRDQALAAGRDGFGGRAHLIQSC